MTTHAFTARWASGKARDTSCSICGRERSEHAPMTNAQRQAAYRARRDEQGLQQVRVYAATEADAAAIQRYAARLLRRAGAQQ